MYGTGEDVQEALSDLCAAITEYYETLKDDEGNLGLLTSQHYAFLKQIIEENQD
jgi:predicted RNase H-like HicB family nuclease